MIRLHDKTFEPFISSEEIDFAIKNLAKQMSHGDEIISIDSQKLSEMPFCDVLNLGKELKNKEKVTIDYRNKENEIRSIVIEK